MHACGHDGHTAMLLAAALSGAAAELQRHAAPDLSAGGRRRRRRVMIEDGLFERFPCDAVFAMQRARLPRRPQASPAAFMCSADTVHHPARPRRPRRGAAGTVDPVVACAAPS